MYDQTRLLLGSGAVAEALRPPGGPGRPSGPVHDLLDRMARNHAVQWDAEDECRRPAVTLDELGRLKRRIDTLNRVRTNLVDALDSWVAGQVRQADSAPAYAETYGSLLDRIVITALRADRLHSEHADSDRAGAATVQYSELLVAYDTLVDEVQRGQRRFPSWRPLKFYATEPAAHPVLTPVESWPASTRCDANRPGGPAATSSTAR